MSSQQQQRSKPSYPTSSTSIIAPSILSADFARLGDESKRCLDEWDADWLHVDIMDAHFVPNLTIGPPVVQALRQYIPYAYLDCHCMISQPQRWVSTFAKAGCDSYTFHYEAAVEQQVDILQLLDSIHEHDMRACISIKPKTPASAIYQIVDSGKVDMILVMTVEPGFGGQAFMSDQVSKVRNLRQRYPHINIEVDGGVVASDDSIVKVSEAGANVIVSGSGVFKAKDPRDAVEKMRQINQQYIKQRQQQQ